MMNNCDYMLYENKLMAEDFISVDLQLKLNSD